MKQLFTLLLATMCAVCTWAEDFEVDGIYYNILTDKTNEVEVTYYGSYSHSYLEYYGSVTIPSSVTYNGTTYSVTSIGEGAFALCYGLTSVNIGNSVTSIGYQAFYGCDSLTSVTIGNSVTSIGYRAFYDCSGLTSIVWNAKNCDDFSYSYSPFSYSDSPFYDIRSQITSFTFGDSVKHVPAYLCYEMSNLTSVTIPNSVTSIGKKAFCRCSGLRKISLGSGLKTIGADAFMNCPRIYEVTCLAQEPPVAEQSSFTNYDAYFHAPSDTQRYYSIDPVWKNFHNVE